MAAKGAMGPVGWALAVVDLVSLALDLFNVGGYDNVESIQQFLIQRETAKKNHNDYLKEQLKEMKKQGVKNPTLNYPRIIGPLDKLTYKEFNSSLSKYEKDLVFMQKNIMKKQLIK